MQKTFNRIRKAVFFWDKPEIYIISYPKTGRTWLRVLIGKSLSLMNDLPEKRILNTEYISAASNLPRTAVTHDGSEMRVRRSYEELNPDKSRYKNKKVILMSRDVRDTLVSAYFHATKRIKVFDGSISEFIRSEHYGARKILTFYRQWHEARNIPKGFHFLFYEDLNRNPETTLTNVLLFLGVKETPPDIIKSAIDFASFDNLKKAEAEHKFASGILTATDGSDPQSYKVREGKIGKYSKYLNQEDVKYVDDMANLLGCEFTMSADSGL